MSSTRSICLLILCLLFSGRTLGESCAKFDVWNSNSTFSADSRLSFSFAVNYTGCDAGYPRIDHVSVERHTSHRPMTHCQIMFYDDGSCYNSGRCRCSPSPDKSYSRIVNVIAQVENPDGETWILGGTLEHGEPIRKSVWIGPVLTREPTFQAEGTATQGFQFLIIIIILSVSLAAAVVVIVVISVVAFCKRQRHVPIQANPMSDDMEMAAVYSQHNADVHHYLALPLNRGADAAEAEAEAEAGDDDGVYEIA